MARNPNLSHGMIRALGLLVKGQPLTRSSRPVDSRTVAAMQRRGLVAVEPRTGRISITTAGLTAYAAEPRRA